MPGIKLTNLLGKAPRIASELLPDTAAQIARNCKLQSGDLVPYRTPVVVDNTGRTGITKTIFGLRDPDNAANIVPLAWNTEVSVVTEAPEDDKRGRFYFTGDGVPKVSDFNLATSGSKPYPVKSYELGLPIPEDSRMLTATPLDYAEKTTQSISRDDSGIVTLKTTAPHNLKTGNFVSVSEFAYRTGSYVQGPLSSSRSGSFSQAEDTLTITVTMINHGLTSGLVVNLSFLGTSSHTKTIDGILQDATQETTIRGGTQTTTITEDGQVTTIGDITQTTTVTSEPGDYFSEDITEYTENNTINGAYTVAVIDKDRFAITGPDAKSRSGTVTWDNVGSTAIDVTMNNHGLADGAAVTLDFISGAAPDGTFTISEVTTNTFRVYSTAAAASSGDVKWDIRSLNAVNAECTVVDDTTITYFSPGPKMDTYASTDGRLNLAGLTQARSYLFTWYTPWDEESIGSKPTEEEYIKEGVTVTISNIPIASPSGGNFIRGVRLYRTLPSQSGTEFFRLATLWFPHNMAGAVVKRVSNVVTVTTVEPHNLSEGDRFVISGASRSTINIIGGEVEEYVDAYTFTYAQGGTSFSNVTLSSGTIYYDVSENPPDTTARYWGYNNNYTFTDDFESTGLFDILATDGFIGPPDDMQGIVRVQSNFLAGFVGNKLYFSEFGEPHAWPRKYVKTFEENIVALTVVSGSVLVLTEGYPYIVSGSDPAAMSDARIDAHYPCLSAKSVVSMEYGVVYATHDGLALYSPAATTILTRLMYDRETWQGEYNPRSVVAQYYGSSYVASTDTNGFVFELDQKSQVGGFFVDIDFTYDASWYDSVSGVLYSASGTNGDLYKWGVPNQPFFTQEWKSKTIVTKDFINLGAGRVIADYNGEENPVTFRLWVNKVLKAERTVTSNSMFRLPTGYLSDTFEVGVEGNVRIRAIHLAETPSGLKEV